MRQVLRQEGGGVARPAACQHEGLGVDHETVHETQQHRNHQYPAELGQLDVAEHGELAGPVDASRLVIGIGDAAQARKTQQRHQRCPVPHIHHQHRDPGMGGVAGVAVVEAQGLEPGAQQADVGAAVDLPDGAHHVPGNEQRNGHQHQHRRGLPAGGRHGQGQHDAQRDLHRQHRERIGDLPQQRRMQVIVPHRKELWLIMIFQKLQ